jgi:hypothetical protein
MINHNRGKNIKPLDRTDETGLATWCHWVVILVAHLSEKCFSFCPEPILQYIPVFANFFDGCAYPYHCYFSLSRSHFLHPLVEVHGGVEASRSGFRWLILSVAGLSVCVVGEPTCVRDDFTGLFYLLITVAQ